MKLTKSKSRLEAAADALIQVLKDGCARPIEQSIEALHRIAAVEGVDETAQEKIARELWEVTRKLRRDTGRGSPWAVLPTNLWAVERELTQKKEAKP